MPRTSRATTPAAPSPAVMIVLPSRGLSGAQPAGAAAARPNSVVILADDLGYSDVRSYGSEVSAANLDALARDGLRFRQFHNNARCSSTRASLLTVMYLREAGMGGLAGGAPGTPGPYQRYLPDTSRTIAGVLCGPGYRTCFSGKWHVRDHAGPWPNQRVFTRSSRPVSGATSYFELLRSRGRSRQMVLDGDRWQPWARQAGTKGLAR